MDLSNATGDEAVKVTTLGTSHGDPTYCRFNTSTLLEVEDYGAVLIDAGTPVLAMLIRQQIPLDQLRAVFITHMHQDHFGGLPDILKYVVKRLDPAYRIKIFLPEVEAMETVYAFTELAHRKIDRKMFEVVPLIPGQGVLAENLTFEAVATDHFSNENLHFPSFALQFYNNDKSVLFTGDLARDLHDFPRGRTADMVCCELTHFHLENLLPIVQNEKFGKLVFNHVGNPWHGNAAEKKFYAMTGGLPYAVHLAHDGDVFEV